MGTQTPSAPLGDDRDTRDKCKAAWHAWWKAHEKKIDLAKLEEAPKMLNRTLIVLLDQASVLELGPDNQPRWQVKGLVFPLDAQMIDDDRFIVAEYHGNRVTERNTRGEVLWQKAVQGPLAAQRLPNGNTFIATDHQLLEFDKNEKQVVNISFENEGRKIMKAMKLPGGEIACMLADSRIVRYDATGKELHTFDITLGMRLFGGRVHMLPTGRVLVPHHAEGKVVEYDSKGKIVWEVPFEQPIAAVRLPNGHTMITSMNAAIGAVEVDRAGREVWSYRHESNTRVTRAIKR
jgi:outer membrane protein assembly factor BamB